MNTFLHVVDGVVVAISVALETPPGGGWVLCESPIPDRPTTMIRPALTIDLVWIEAATVQEARQHKWAAIKAERENRLTQGTFEALGMTFDSNATMIGGAVTLAMLDGEGFSVDWTLADNTVVQLGAGNMILVGAAQAAYTGGLFDTARALRASIQQAQTIEQVEAVVWPTSL